MKLREKLSFKYRRYKWVKLRSCDEIHCLYRRLKPDVIWWYSLVTNNWQEGRAMILRLNLFDTLKKRKKKVRNCESKWNFE